MRKEIYRKLFHLSALIFVVGLVFLNRYVFRAVLTLIVLFEGIFEVVRLGNEPVNAWVQKWFGPLMREEESRRFSGVFWLMCGVLATSALLDPLPLAVAAILFLILGDGAASLAGQWLNGPTWKISSKTLAGSFACFLVCLGIGFILLRPEYGWGGIMAGALVATVVEIGIIPLNDNFLIPVATSVAFIIAYGLKLFFL